MHHFTKIELSDMHMTYVRTHDERRIYWDQHHIPCYTSLDQSIGDAGEVGVKKKDLEANRPVRNVVFEEEICQ